MRFFKADLPVLEKYMTGAISEPDREAISIRILPYAFFSAGVKLTVSFSSQFISWTSFNSLKNK